MIRYRRGAARRAKLAEILWSVVQLYEKLHLKSLVIGKWPWGSLKVIGIVAIL